MYSRKSIPANVKMVLWKRDCGISIEASCPLCGCRIDYNNCHVAHIIPLAKGGSNNITNLKITCQSCNLSMGTKNLNTFHTEYFGVPKINLPEIYTTTKNIKLFINQNDILQTRSSLDNSFINFVIATHLTQ